MLENILPKDAATVAQPHPSATNGAHPSNSTSGAPLDGLTFDFSTFNGQFDNVPKRESRDWRGVIDLLKARKIREAKDGPLISGATYPAKVLRKDGKIKSEIFSAQNETPEDLRPPIRCNEFVESVSLAILDFDGGATLEEIKAGVSRLNNGDGAAAFLYSTHSHTPDKPKFRLVLPLLAPIPATDWLDVWKRVDHHFDEKTDDKARDAARMQLQPSCPKDRKGDAISLEIDGGPLDVATLPHLPVVTREAPHFAPQFSGGDPYARKAFENEIERLRSTSGNRNDALNDAALALGHFVGAGRLDRYEVENALFDAARSNGYIAKDGERETRGTIQSGLTTGEREPNLKGLPEVHLNGNHTARLRAPKIEAAPESSEPPAPSRLVKIGDLHKRPAPKWLIQRFLLAGATSLFTADSGSYKSFIALHIAYCKAHGLSFFGREVKESGTVVYVAGEGGDGLRARSMAWDSHHDRESPDNLFVWENAVQVANAGEVAEFLGEIEQAGIKPALIIFDTLNRCAEGLEENSARDMGLFCAGLDRIKRATGAHVCVVHHNNANGRSRGSTALPGAFDTRFSAEREGQTVTLRCQKQKDGAAEFDPFALAARVIEIGELDEYGDPITSLVLEATGEPVAISSGPSKSKTERTADAVLEVLVNLRKSSEKVTKTEWEEAVTAAKICGRSKFFDHTKALESDRKWSWQYGDCVPSPESPESPEMDEMDKMDANGNREVQKVQKVQNTVGIGLSGLNGLHPTPDKSKQSGGKKKSRNAASEPYVAPVVDGEAAGVDEF